jgi:hypothetical protein
MCSVARLARMRTARGRWSSPSDVKPSWVPEPTVRRPRAGRAPRRIGKRDRVPPLLLKTELELAGPNRERAARIKDEFAKISHRPPTPVARAYIERMWHTIVRTPN